LSPRSFFCFSVGVTVGSLKIALSFAPDATASCKHLSSVLSRETQLRSKYSHLEVSM